MEKTALFCYGTLQSPLVMKVVTGQPYEGREATLIDWARYRVRGSEYPGIVPQEGSLVCGKLYWGLDEQAVEKLDAFEGDKYERVLVNVILADGSNQQAYVYAIRQDCRTMLSNDPWDFDRFLQNGLERFIHWFVEDRRDLFDRGDL
ncbi:gamma-glutamylcyclotransferase family protein [Desulfobulbus oligotrophicus]|jgi:gamma-glutamylcyclotransferase (GGCT)/AIG2-like uncharacterized protein YtfP|nr:gamma-glutamylcyclotransferase family protein [Desulfobulbus oligotrophicus]MDY0390443.1 gamma-glutamylcyclotransferase family protein [Desulfobulbus oligotrophicus]